ncbi:carbohydrate ABC transporter permease [Paenibacillus sp. J5C_2022]|uniref:carbohydrate ABC transporter permease n=1 Tax=Paenibacillus sp. J5C2022 TaxID=2977129 RepID=UPI0021D08A42|nr:carbohydrate ABC transporter permease [Paenibacillus sp. J5C2022]MCU6712674.1 carbohydrate ABC transporter permease [Paenibacillus sp. J5C2022]
MAHKTSLYDKLFTACNYLFFLFLGVITLFPFLNLIAKSLSSEEAVISGQVGLLPVDIQFGTYNFVITDSMFLGAFRNSVIVTVVGTLLGLLMTTMSAYPLSRARLRGRKWFILLFVFTMLFSGGLIPTYLLLSGIGLVNKLPVLFLPAMVNVFNLLVIKSYFESLPDALEESAKIDGASNFRIFYGIILPLSMPVLATIALFFAVQFWNDFFMAMVYISNPELKPLQLYLKELLASANNIFMRTDMIDVNSAMNASPQAIQAAAIIVATIPIILVYPFLQKYFVKGVMLGSVKG